ncbi:DUF4084 domain-containing protein [Neobacillus driksii]|nr:DUF4084 domain-containing protein [Neobacillus niacini]
MFTSCPPYPSIILYFIYRKQKTNEKYLWLFLSLGCFFNFMTLMTSRYFSQKEFLYLEWNDSFYILQIGCFLIAFICKIRIDEHHNLLKFTFDTCIVMAAAIAFSWHFIIRDLQTQHIFIGYPIGDLILFFGAMIFYLVSEKLSPFRVLILSSLLIQVVADCSYLFFTMMNIPFSEGLFYPLWSLSPLLLGIAGTLTIANGDTSPVTKNKIHSLKESITLRLLLPYISVILLFIIMISQHHDSISLIIGSEAAILLLIVRHIFASLVNQTLLAKYHELTEELELKIGERTEELSSKNRQLLSAARKMKYMAYHDV